MIGQNITIIGVNAAGITCKMESFDKLLFDVNPSIFMIQESKRKSNAPKMKAKNLQNYQVFELRRQKSKEEGGKGLCGGGLVVGALHDLKPVLVRQGDDDVECITIEVTAGITKFRCVNGYGPQLSDTKDRKDKFWNYLDKEVIEADEKNIGLVIEIDSNSWAGSDIIPNDPNAQNLNGKMLQMFLERNKGLCLVNSLSICEGLITRKRSTDNRDEKSAIDLFIVSKIILPLVTKMHVDEKGEHQLSIFNGIRHNKKVTESDHAKIELSLNIQFPRARPARIEEHNFRSNECQKYFQEITTNTRKLSMCFQNKKSFSEQIHQWQRNLRGCIFQAFPKVRSRKRKFIESEVGKLLEERKRVKLDLSAGYSEEKEHYKNEIEDRISKATEYDFMKKVQETLGHIKGDDGGINTNGLWKAKNNLIPKDKLHNPVALFDKKGNLITNPEGIKQLCLEEMVERLRHRKIKPDLIQLQHLKEKLCKKRLELAEHKKSEPWTHKQLDKVLSSLKNGKCRDPEGLINELFKHGVAGQDLKDSILHIMNMTKPNLEIPEFMKKVNVTMLPKPGKPGLHDLENQRGIFLISVFRSILMKLVLKDKYEALDNYMTDSNIGGRQGRRIQDHLFIVNGILFENSRKKKSKPLSICIYDCRQCFDSLWQDEVINDLFEAGVDDDNLSLLYKINNTNNLAVKTQHGLTQRKTIKKIICQGDPWG